MFSFYVVTPAGFQLEFGYGARTIDEPWTENRRYDRISEWGHQPLQSPLHAEGESPDGFEAGHSRARTAGHVRP